MLVLICGIVAKAKALFGKGKGKESDQRPVVVAVPRERMYQGKALEGSLLAGPPLSGGSQ